MLYVQIRWMEGEVRLCWRACTQPRKLFSYAHLNGLKKSRNNTWLMKKWRAKQNCENRRKKKYCELFLKKNNYPPFSVKCKKQSWMMWREISWQCDLLQERPGWPSPCFWHRGPKPLELTAHAYCTNEVTLENTCGGVFPTSWEGTGAGESAPPPTANDSINCASVMKPP